jgi:hypothetical protein
MDLEESLLILMSNLLKLIYLKNKKMKTTNLILSLFTIAVLCSCGVTHNTGLFHEKNISNAQITTDHVHADMVFDESKKIKGDATAFYFLIFKVSGDNHYADVKGSMAFSKAAKVKAAAKYDALNDSGADFIAKPGYTVTKRSYLLGLFSQIDANVSGYKGTYKNFKQVDPLERNLENAVNKKLVDKLNLNK